MNDELFEAFNDIVIGAAEGLLDDDGVDEQEAAAVARALVAEARATIRPDEDLITAARGAIDAWESCDPAEALKLLKKSLEQC